MRKTKLELDESDVLQILDGLEVRAETWAATARFLRDGFTSDDTVIEKCSDAEEADSIAKHYQDIIASIERQLRE